MSISIISIGTALPEWTYTACNEYIKRTPAPWDIDLIEVPAQKRTKTTNVKNLLSTEAAQLLKRVPKNTYSIALERQGQIIDSKKIARRLSEQLNQGKSIALLVGGPEGLAPEATESADALWSLSALTFPHPLVRVMLCEQIYRAYSICHNHPYHK